MNRYFLCSVLALASLAVTMQAQAPPKPKSPKEVEALKAMFAAQDPDSRIAAADNVLTKFADTEFKAIALYFTAASYEQKNDFDKMVVYAERTIEADPKNYNAMLMLARALASKTRENDLDKEEKLGRAEKYANGALDIIKDATKPNPQITDDQWLAAKKDLQAQAYEALGIAAMARKKFDAAASEFKLAVETPVKPEPATMVRLAAAYNQAKQYDSALAVLDKVMAIPDLVPAVRQFAQAEKVRATQGRAAAAPKP